MLPLDSPHYDDDKVQHVPAVSDVGVLVHDQAIGNNLQKCLYSENDQEGIFYCFLYGGKDRKNSRKGERQKKRKEKKEEMFIHVQVHQNFNKEIHCGLNNVQ